MSRKSPNEHASDNQYKILFGNDSNLWVAKPDKNHVFKWTKVNKIASLPIKFKYDYLEFLKFFKKVKFQDIQFYHYENLIPEIEKYLENSDDNDDNDDKIDSRDSDYFNDNGFFAKYEIDDYIEDNGLNKNNILIISDTDLIQASQHGNLSISGYSTYSKKQIREIFKNYKIVHLNKSSNDNDVYMEIELKHL